MNGISKDEFINRIRRVLGAPPIPGAAQPAAATTTPQAPSPEPAEASSPAEPASQSRTPDPRSVSSTPPLSAKAKGKQKATEPEPTPEVSATNAARQTARDALRKRKHEEKEELARIKARIEADKAERKAQAEARRAERERQAQSSPTTSQFPTTRSTKGSQAKEVHLNVRLFDGHTIRSTFARTANLQDDVRPWIDQEFAAKAENPRERHPPYFFKQILAPLPSRELSAGDESQTLGDIDLAPSATLVLIPVKGYTEAYSGGAGGIVSGATGSVMGLVGGAFSLAGSALGYVGSTLSSVLGGGGADTSQTPQQGQGRTAGEQQQQHHDAPGSSSIRVRTLADERAREPRSQQLYNGNQVSLGQLQMKRSGLANMCGKLNFEPRDEDANR